MNDSVFKSNLSYLFNILEARHFQISSFELRQFEFENIFGYKLINKAATGAYRMINTNAIIMKVKQN